MISDAIAGVCQTVCNSIPSDVVYPGANTQANHEQRSPSSSQELSLKKTPMRSGAKESDSSSESKTSDLFPDESILGNDFKSCEDNLMLFAEILYKCTLCTSLPSILTSKGSFLAHVTSQHLTKQASFQDCSQCDLKFGTDEDLRSHIDCSHAMLRGERVEADKLSDTESVDDPATPSSGMEERLSTPRPPLYVASPSNKPRLESPNQNKKDFPCNKYQLVKQTAPVVKVNDLPKSENISKIQKLTDQIVQAQTPGSQANLLQSWSSMSSFTPEFGRYTKLVREGGNIVYFCQVCNWKCQVKAAFQAHCNGPHHNNKVRIADQNNPHRKRGSSSNSPGLAGGSPSHCRSPTGLLTFANKPEVESFRADTPCDSQNGGTMDMKRSEGVPVPSHVSGNGVHVGPGMSDMPFLQGLLSSHRTDEKRELGSNFVFQKRWENDASRENNCQDSQFEKTTRALSPIITNPGSGEHSPTEKDSSSTPRNKRKRPAPVCLRNQIGSGNSWSDSDSDECTDRGKTCESSSDSDQPDAKKPKHAESSPVLRDDFHSRLMKKALSGHAHVEKTVGNSQPLGHSEHMTPYFQNSFRNRLFASAFGASFGPMYGWFGQPNPLFQSPMCSNDETVSREKASIDHPYDNLVHYGSKLFQNCFTPFNYTGKHRQVSEALASRHDTRPQSDTSDKGDNSPKSDDTSCDRTVFKREPTDSDEAVFRCSMCEFTCQDIVDYRHHFMAEHGVDGADSLLGESQFSTMNEGWKMSKIRDTLPGELSIQIPGSNTFHYRSYQCF